MSGKEIVHAVSSREKDVLDLWPGRSGEGAKIWMRALTDLRNRGIKDVFFVVCDGLKGAVRTSGHPQVPLQRDPASSISLDNIGNVVRLLEIFSRVDAEDQIQVLVARDPAPRASRGDVAGAMRLTSCLRNLGSEEHADAVLARSCDAGQYLRS